jgi:argininosuccinate lyase
MMDAMTPNTQAMHDAAGRGFSTATDLADWLVREADLPFRQAHHVTGALVALAEAQGKQLSELSLPQMQAEDGRITEGVFAVLSVENSVASRTSHGGTAPDNVRAAAAAWLAHLGRPDTGEDA